MKHAHLPALILATVLILCVATHAAAGSAQPDVRTPSQRLADQLARVSLQLLRSEPLTTAAIEAAAILLSEAVQLHPDDADLWRLTIDLATMLEDTESKDRAVEQLLLLDPADDVVRFMAAHRSVERHQMAEERAAAYRALLAPAERERLGPAAASRLAMDMALLERRRGDTRAFSRWLAEAVTLDPSNAAAAGMAAGFFRMRVEDAFAEAELLSTLFLANPIDTNAQVALAAHLLDHGAYAGAERLYRLAVASHRAVRAQPSDGVVADLAIAQWGRGDASGALVTVRDRQREADLQLRWRLMFERPELTSMDRARFSATLQPALATTRAALRRRVADPLTEAALDQAVQSHLHAIDELRAASDETTAASVAAAVARLQLEAAWTILWLGGDPQRAEVFIGSASEYQPLSDAAVARFEGWALLNRGDAAGAIERLEPYAAEDVAARLGYATALLEQGQQRSAAGEFLAVARSQPGTLIGVWAADRLSEMLGRTVIISEAAAALEQLIAAIPAAIYRYAENPTAAVSMRLLTDKTTFAAFEPIILTIEITNHAPIPLAIDPAGPIRPQLIVRPSAQVTGMGRADPGPYVVELNRRFRLMPRERLIIRVDLRRTALAAVLDQAPARGAMVRVRAILNPMATADGALVPGLLGSEVDIAPIRVDGARLTHAWVDETIARALNIDEVRDLPRLALLSQLAAIDPSPEAPESDRSLLRDARSAFAEAFAELGGISQAWLLTVIPVSPTLDAALTMGRKNGHRYVRLAYLAFRLQHVNDPILEAALQDDDARVRRLAQALTFLLRHRDAAGREP